MLRRIVGTAVGAWALAGYRILGVPNARLVQSERSVFSPAGQDGVLERVFEIIEPTHRYLLPPQRIVIGFHPMTWWDEPSPHFGASLQSLFDLGRRKGYELVAVTDSGFNLFFVDAPYFERFRIKDNSPERLFRPYNYSPALGPQDLHILMTEDGRAKPPAEDIVLDEVRIPKRFRFDR